MLIRREISHKKIDSLKIFLAVSSGLLLTGAFPRTGRYWFAWFALVPLLIALKDISTKNAFRLGFLTGLIHYLTLLYWLVQTMTQYGNLPLYLSVALFFLLSAYLALYTGIFSMSLTGLCPTPATALFMIPLSWVTLEYIRSFLFTGFPWELVGYSQFNLLNIIQISDLFGVYGVSFLIALSNAVLFLIFLHLSGKTWQGEATTKRLAAGSIFTIFLIVSLVWFYGKWRIQSIDRLISAAPTARVAVIQGNIEQSIKWDPAFQISTINKYTQLSLSAKKGNPDLLVWPETATPFYFLKNKPLSKMVQKAIHAIDADFLIGSPSFVAGRNNIEYYNSAYLVSPEGTVYGRYDKAHLVPFGEYIPFHEWLPFLDKMVEGVGDFRPGKSGKTIPWGSYKLGLLICYEIIFPPLSRAMTENNAALLINITNDAWYGRSSAPYQHFSMAVFRAVENRRSLIRSANTGVSGFIDPVGRIIAPTSLFKKAVVTRSIPIIHNKTVYTRYGDLFPMACLALTLIAGLLNLYRSFKRD